MKFYAYVLILLSCISCQIKAQESISVCTDDDDWFPYVYLKSSNVQSVEGIVISLTDDVFAQLGFKAHYLALPWLRCMEQLKRGTVDVVIAGTYTEERAKYAHFPADAEKLVNSQYVLARDPFVVITHKDNNFMYRSNDAEIPAPIRAQHGYNITNQLIKSGLDVKKYYSNQSALEDLLRSKQGSVLINRMSADNILTEPKYGDYLHYNSTPIRVVPYFIMFSKSSNKLTEKQRNSFYNEIKHWRERKKNHYRY